MTLMNEQNDFIRNIIAYTSKSLYAKGAIFNSTLCLITLNGILFEVDLSGKIDPSVICSFDSVSLSQNPEYIIDNPGIFNEVYSKYELVANIRCNRCVFSNDALREDPIFDQIATAKSSDGASNYFITTDTGINTFITLFRGMFNLTKPDKAGMKIYEIPVDSRTMLAEFTIYKKKINTNYTISFLFMNFGQRRIL